MDCNNILVVNTFGIGDVLFSTPLLKQIKRNLPDSNIYYLCNKRNRDLLKNDPDIKGLIVYEKDEFRVLLKKSRLNFVKKLLRLVGEIRKLKIDIALDLTLNYQINTILILAGVKKRVGFNYKNRGRLLTHKIPLDSFRTKHVAEYYLELLKFLGLDISQGERLRSYTSSDDKLAADSFLKANGLIGKRLVGIIAAGGKSWGPDALYRRWPTENFAYVGKKLSELDDIRVLIFGTREESAICGSISKSIGEGCVSLCGNTSLSLLVELISRCELVICNEGGPLHIAVSQDIKTISIFGPVDDRVYGPYPESPKHIVIKADSVECRPCYKNFKHEICDNHSCLTTISKESVFEAAKGILGLWPISSAT